VLRVQENTVCCVYRKILCAACTGKNFALMSNYFIKIGTAKSNTTCGYFIARELNSNRYDMSIKLLSNKISTSCV